VFESNRYNINETMMILVYVDNIIIKEPMKMSCDNQLARHIATSVFCERTKHIEINCHFIRENVQSKKTKTSFVKSENQLSIFLQKG
jgi:hypothetical protein